MTKEELNKSIESGELQLSVWAKFTHFSIVIFFGISAVVLLAIQLFFYLPGGSYFKTGEIYFIIVPTIIASLFYWLQKSRLKFKVIPTNLTWPEILILIKQVSKELEWIPTDTKGGVFIAFTNPGFWSGSWGERITILYNNNRLYINSICDPDKRQSVVSMGRNRRNVESVVNCIKNEAIEKVE